MDVLRRSLLSLGLALLVTGPAAAQPQDAITVASTTSTEQSGLFKVLLPKFTEKTGIGVKVVALGTGQALDVGRRGDADVVFVHDRAAEEKFVAEGAGGVALLDQGLEAIGLSRHSYARRRRRW